MDYAEMLCNNSTSDLKEEFQANLSHNLRAPLTSMKLALIMLRKTTDEALRERYLSIIEEECNKEILFINDLLSPLV